MVNDPDRPDEADRTSRMPPVEPDATRMQGSDSTRIHGSDPTEVQGEAAAPRWSARANVPPPGAAPPVWTEPAVEEDPYGGRSWFTPIIVGVVALLLAAALAVGVWLIYRATSKGEGVVEPSPSPVASSPSPRPSPTRSPSPSPSASPSASPAAEVTIPSLRGDTELAATARLRQLGLTVVVQRRSDSIIAAGRVVDTNPSAGSSVPAGAQVTLIVSSGPSPAASRTSRPPSPAAPN